MPNNTVKRVVIYPYKISSASSKVLAEALRADGISCIRAYADRTYRWREGDLVINWGSSRKPNWTPNKFFNDPDRVNVSSNKIWTFQCLFDSPVDIPLFTLDKQLAERRLGDGDWPVVYCRTLLNSHSGKGIVVAKTVEELVDAPLYTEGITHKNRVEFRVHVFDNKVIDIAQKRKKNSERREELGETLNSDIRSFNNGWCFCRGNDFSELVTTLLSNQCLKAIRVLGLDFGAVDICAYQERGGEWSTRVFEVNSSPGLEGATITAYKNAIKELVENG